MGMPKNNLCKCGCGEYCMLNYKRGHCSNGKFKRGVVPVTAFKKGHKPWNTGLTKETDERVVSKSEKQSRTVKQKFNDGYKVWNDGLTKETDPRVANISAGLKKFIKNQKLSDKWVDQLNSEKAMEKRLETHKTKSYKEKMSKISIEHWQDPVYREKQIVSQKRGRISRSQKMKNNWKDSEFVSKVLSSCGKSPNRLEMEFEGFLQTNFPDELVFSGDGSFWITYKKKHYNPDYINIKRKKIIELFGDHWHTIGEADIRARVFLERGYSCLIIWESSYKNNRKAVLKNISAFLAMEKCLVKFITMPQK